MNKKLYLLPLAAMLLYVGADSQSPAPVAITDSMPAAFNGLQMGYTILSAKEKEVGNKGNFSRYSIRFYVTNTSGQAKVLMYKQGFSIGDGVSPTVAQFNCLNATGARLTLKQATLDAEPCNVLAMVEDQENGKPKMNKRFVQIGYWIKAGQTIHTDGIVIVPLNELPNMVVTPVFNTNQLVGDAYLPPIQQAGPQPFNYGNVPAFIKLQNLGRKTFLNNQNGPVTCSPVQDGWWSAHWQIVPVNGTNFYLVKNRWKDVYLSTEDPASMLSVNAQSRASMWAIEAVDATTIRFRNIANNTYLNNETGTLQSTMLQPGAWSGEWVMVPAQ